MLIIVLKAILFYNRSFTYIFFLRLGKYGFISKPLGIIVHKILGVLYCIDIPRRTSIGPGFYIGHAMCIVINPTTVIHENVTLSQFTNIGRKTRGTKCAVIESGCYFGPHVSVFGQIIIGQGSSIGAGAVVNKDIPPFSVAVGVPARVIKTKEIK